jgi:glutamate synthase domain-containing protein 3
VNAVKTLTLLLDHLHLIPYAKDGRVRASLESSLFKIFRGFPLLSEMQSSKWSLLRSADELRSPNPGDGTLLVDVSDLASEGEGSASQLIVAAYKAGWRHVVSFDWRGQRFCGAGLGEHSNGLRLDVYGNPGDYLGSGLDGAEVYVHASGQDQVAQIMKSGKLVIYGDVGQTFMYAAKGGEAYVLGNAAGRPLINAVGQPRVVINGTCLDYLAESFMAGDPLNGGGFVIVNGVRCGDDGRIIVLETPYPGSNLFSLASGGAIYLRDPMGVVGSDQLNGGQFTTVEGSDWNLIFPYLQENQNLFQLKVEDLLRIEGQAAKPSEVYRKVEAIPLKALAMADL